MDIFLFAGEASGDLHGEKLLEALLEKHPKLHVAGVGGPKMRSLGMECWMPMENFEVMGFIDVFFALPRLVYYFYTIRKKIIQANPKIVVTIDYPGFTLRLARSLRKKGFKGKICHYICPSVWAWGKNRVELMSQNIDLLLSILPFEKEYFSSTSLPVAYVGHPLISRMEKILSLAAVEKREEKKRIALFPGSRKKEITRNLPLFLYAAKKILQVHPTISFSLSVSHPQFLPLIKKLVAEATIPVLLVASEKNSLLFQTSFLAIAKSGTVTLELALAGIPTVVAYALTSIDTFLAKHIFKIDLPYYCLVNIIGKKSIFPELIGPSLTPESLYKEIENYITHKHLRQKSGEGCAAVRKQLSKKCSSKESAAKILALL